MSVVHRLIPIARLVTVMCVSVATPVLAQAPAKQPPAKPVLPVLPTPAVLPKPSAGPTAGSVPPTLLVLRVGSSSAEADEEERLTSELGIILDGFAVFAVPPGDPTFASSALQIQLQRIGPLVQRYGAVAAVWLARPSRETRLLHVVAMRTGRTMVRSLEPPKQKRREAQLALAVRELLGAAYLFEPEAPSEPEMQKVVTEVRASVGTPALEETSEPQAREWSWVVLGARRGGLSHHVGETGESSLETRVERSLEGPLWWSVGLEAALGPRMRRSGEDLRGWRAAVGAELEWRLHLGSVQVGPRAGFRLHHVELTSQISPGPEERFTTDRLGVRAGAQISYKLGERLAVVIEPSAEWLTPQATYRRDTTREVVVSTPAWVYAVGAGVGFTWP